LAIICVVAVDHNRTTRPSKITTIYLIFALMGDGVLLRTLYMRDYIPRLNPIITTSAACKLLLLLVESWPKTSYLKPTPEPLGPIDTASPINRALFWWLNPLLLYGNRNILKLSDLLPLDHDLHSEPLRERMSEKWEICVYNPSS
jgi:ATP-binding cassette, subfamily C (CFTR/MRP), member 1